MIPRLGLTAARSLLPALEELRTKPGAELRAGVEVEDERGTVRIETNHVQTSDLPEAMRNHPSRHPHPTGCGSVPRQSNHDRELWVSARMVHMVTNSIASRR